MQFSLIKMTTFCVLLLFSFPRYKLKISGNGRKNWHVDRTRNAGTKSRGKKWPQVILKIRTYTACPNVAFGCIHAIYSHIFCFFLLFFI